MSLTKLETYEQYLKENNNRDEYQDTIDRTLDAYKKLAEIRATVQPGSTSPERDAIILLTFTTRTMLSMIMRTIEDTIDFHNYDLEDGYQPWIWTDEDYKYLFLDNEVASEICKRYADNYYLPIKELDKELGIDICLANRYICGTNIWISDFSITDDEGTASLFYPGIGWGREKKRRGRWSWGKDEEDDNNPAKHSKHYSKRLKSCITYWGDLLDFPDDIDENFDALLKGADLRFTRMHDLDMKAIIPWSWEIRDDDCASAEPVDGMLKTLEWNMFLTQDTECCRIYKEANGKLPEKDAQRSSTEEALEILQSYVEEETEEETQE